ncbi:MAG: hypothetical protein RL022_2278, partial [Chloroflexota bacterium]
TRFIGIHRGRGQRLTRWNRTRHNRLVQGGRGDYGLGRHEGFENVFFHGSFWLWFELPFQRGTSWRRVQPIMASNGGGPSRLQSARLVAAVAELGSLAVIAHAP